MRDAYSLVAQLCELRDGILRARLSQKSLESPHFDPLMQYSMSLAIQTDPKPEAYRVELVAAFSSGGGEESAYCMEKRASLLLGGDSIKIRCSGESGVISESYSLDERGSDACIERLRRFFA